MVSNCSLSKLTIIQLSIKAILLQQFVVPTLLNDVAVADDQDQIGVANSAQPMGDDEASFALHQLVHSFLDEHFGAGVDRASGLIQNGNTTLLSSKADVYFIYYPTLTRLDKITRSAYTIFSVGVWRSSVARTVRDGEVVRSNRITPTMKLFEAHVHHIEPLAITKAKEAICSDELMCAELLSTIRAKFFAKN